MTTQAVQICLAPLRGVTSALFRTTFAEFFRGVDWAVAPFLTTTQGEVCRGGRLRDVLPENNPLMPVIPQILGKQADKFIHLARSLQDLGYDTVNWNLGCPFPRVARKQRGSGLLPHPDRIDAFLEQVFTETRLRISIKARLGRHTAEEIFALIPVFNRYPLKELILHPRTGIQMYTGRPDWDTFEKCLPLVRCPVIYNGDIQNKSDFDRLQRRFPTITTWMIGRGTIGNPSLPGLIKGLIDDDIDWVGRFRRFHDALYHRLLPERHGPAHLVDSMKGYWGYFAVAFAAGDRILKQVRKSRDAVHYQEIVSRFFDGDAHAHYFDSRTGLPATGHDRHFEMNSIDTSGECDCDEQEMIRG
jgi:tRNA-dihydrouridine synthase B